MISKISQVLRETDVQQVTGFLIKYDGNGELEGKCAMGVLSCESGNNYLKLDRNRTTVSHSEILDAYGIEDNCTYPILDHPAISRKEIGWDFSGQNLSLSSIIIRLNDTFKFTFEEIAEFLEVTFDL